MPPKRFRLRTMILVVAFLTLVMGLATLARRRDHYRRLAESHALTEKILRVGVDSSMLQGMETMTNAGPGLRLLSLKDSLKHDAKLVDYHAQLRQKYEKAARRPWLTVEPDPPEPE